MSTLKLELSKSSSPYNCWASVRDGRVRHTEFETRLSDEEPGLRDSLEGMAQKICFSLIWWTSSISQTERRHEVVVARLDMRRRWTNVPCPESNWHAGPLSHINARSLHKGSEYQAVQFVIEKQVPIDAPDEFGRTPLYLTVFRWVADALKSSIYENAKPNLTCQCGGVGSGSGREWKHWDLTLLKKGVSWRAQNRYCETPKDLMKQAQRISCYVE